MTNVPDYDAIQRETRARLRDHLAAPRPTEAEIKARIPQPRVQTRVGHVAAPDRK